MVKNVPTWDLSDLYKSISDSQITKDRNLILNNSESFTKKYRGKLENKLLQAILEFEDLDKKLMNIAVFAYLTYSTKSSDAKISKFYQEITEFITVIANKLVWFEIEIKNIDETKFKKLISDKKLQNFRHYLNQLRVFKKYTLSEDKEIILNQKNQTGRSAFVRLYDQSDADTIYKFKGKNLNESEIGNIYTSDKNRQLRKLAAEVMAKKHSEDSKLYVFILNTLLLDAKVNDELRGFKYPQEKTFLSYEVNKKIVDSMVSSITKKYSISQRYYVAKSKLLKQKLFEWDRYSTIYPEIKSNYTWQEACDMILNSFELFSPKFKQIAANFFDKKWIDAAVYKGKRSGGYCYSVSPDTHPYIFINYTGDESSVRTLAHELGHGIHGQLARVNSNQEYHASTATAEIASIFAELLVFDVLYEKAKTKKEKINLLGGKLQEIFATVFRQSAFYLFESKLHEKRRASGELSVEEIGNLYQQQLQPMFGKGLTLSNNHKSMWTKISHFYHYNFYVFTYSMGQLLAIALYAKYKSDGQKFVENYIKALSLGGSKSPTEIAKVMGVDITKPNFWEKGLDLIDQKVKEFERLTK